MTSHPHIINDPRVTATGARRAADKKRSSPKRVEAFGHSLTDAPDPARGSAQHWPRANRRAA